MNSKSKFVLTAFVLSAFFASNIQTCHAMDRVWQKEQKKLIKESEQIKIKPLETNDIQEKVLQETLERIVKPSGRTSPQLISIRNQTNQLLAKEQVKPREIEALKINLNEIADSLRSESERKEYQILSEKLDIIYRYTQSITELKDSYASIVERMNENFEQVDKREAKVSLWKNIISGGFTVSFITNLLALFGFMIKMPNAKLERELKQLQIAEKRAQLKKNGIEPDNYL